MLPANSASVPANSASVSANSAKVLWVLHRTKPKSAKVSRLAEFQPNLGWIPNSFRIRKEFGIQPRSRNSVKVGWIQAGHWLNSEFLPNSEGVRNSAKVRLEFSQPWTLAELSETLAELSETLAELSESLVELAGTLAELTATLSELFFHCLFFLLSCLQYWIVFDCLFSSR